MVSAASSLSVDSSLLRTAYLEILVEEDSRGLHRRCLYRYVTLLQNGTGLI